MRCLKSMRQQQPELRRKSAAIYLFFSSQDVRNPGWPADFLYFAPAHRSGGRILHYPGPGSCIFHISYYSFLNFLRIHTTWRIMHMHAPPRHFSTIGISFIKNLLDLNDKSFRSTSSGAPNNFRVYTQLPLKKSNTNRLPSLLSSVCSLTDKASCSICNSLMQIIRKTT